MKDEARMTPQEELEANAKELRRVNIIGVPGTLALGFGLLGLFGDNPGALHEALTNRNVVYGLVVFGIVSAIWNTYKVYTLSKRRTELANELSGNGAR